MVDAVLFDLDGTLWDATAGITIEWNQALHEAGYNCTITHDEVCSFMGMTLMDIAAKISPKSDEEDCRRIGNILLAQEGKFNGDPEAITKGYCRLFDGVRETLSSLSKNYSLCIVSNCGCGYIENFLANFGLTEYFVDHECFGATGRNKGYNIAEVVRRNGFEHAVYVGDTAGDERSANFAQIPFIHAAYGFGTSIAPDAVCYRFSDIPQILLTL